MGRAFAMSIGAWLSESCLGKREDKIVLLGSSNDYLLGANGSNTEIFLKSTVQGGVNELIAIINNVNNLSLDGTSFEYVAGNPAF